MSWPDAIVVVTIVVVGGALVWKFMDNNFS
jgi:hypothetical protein